MKVNVYLNSARDHNERQILQEFAEGILVAQGREPNQKLERDLGISDGVDLVYSDNIIAADVDVMFGSWKPREKGHHIIRNEIRSRSPLFICIETPLIGRKTSESNNYYRVGINGFLNQAAHWAECSKELKAKRLQEMGVESWPGWQVKQDGDIIIALQLPGDASLRGIDLNNWLKDTVYQIRQHTDRTIRIRTHPLTDHEHLGAFGATIMQLLSEDIKNIKISVGNQRPWNEDLANAWCTVTYTSGLAVDSVLHGIPTIALDVGNFAWTISEHHLENINSPHLEDSKNVKSWLEDLTSVQWSRYEMFSGIAWQYLMPKIALIKQSQQ